MTSFTDTQVQFLINKFTTSYKKSIKESVLFLAPLIKARLNNTMSLEQARMLQSSCSDKIELLHNCGMLTVWAIDIYSESVESSNLLQRVA